MSIKHYSGGPNAKENKTASNLWIRQIAILKIQRFFRHIIAKRKLLKIRRDHK